MGWGQRPGPPDRVKRKHPHSPRKPSLIVKRSLVTAERRISFCLEDAFWNSLEEIAVSKDTSLPTLVGIIDEKRSRPNLSSALRLFVLDYYRGLV
jgi:predicted DNA-binding ribbon-helix-helix protein